MSPHVPAPVMLLVEAAQRGLAETGSPVRLEVSEVAPWFGQPGGGVQHLVLDVDGTVLHNDTLKERDILTLVPRG